MVDRFVGKMHKKMIEERKKSETNLLKNVGGGSRRSSISPSTETIKETKETESAATTPRRPSISKAAKALGKVGDIARKIKRENSLKNEETSSGNTSPSLASSRRSSKSPISPLTSSRSSPSSQRKEKKSAKGKAADNKKAEEEKTADDEEDNKEFKQRIFFIEKTEKTDEEVLSQLGRESWELEPKTNIQGEVKATTFVKKITKEKKTSRVEAPSDQPKTIVYSGSVRDKLIKDANMDKSKVLVGSVKFLGKMMNRKDKHGLIMDQEVETVSKEDNPIFTALERLNIKTQGRDSRTSRSFSSLSNKNSAVTDTTAAAAATAGSSDDAESNGKDKDDVLKVLKGGLCRVTEENIFKWNTNYNDRTDVEVKPIFVPF